MAEFSETEFNLKKKDVLSLCSRISKFLLKDFEKKYEDHKKLDHKWFVQNTIHGVCRNLCIDKQVAIYLILGSNPRREAWGNMKEKYGIEPLKFVMRRDIVNLGKTLDKEYGFKVYFTDTNRNGDFHMKVVFYKHGSEPEKPTFEKKEGKSYASAAYRGKDKPAPAPIQSSKVDLSKANPKDCDACDCDTDGMCQPIEDSSDEE